jgi:DinB superfamily
MEFIRTALWNQFGAALDMLDNAIAACPDELWGDQTREPQFWAMTFHALFWTDVHMSGGVDRFTPPEPFGLEELDPAGVLPPRVYTRAELRGYLAYVRRKSRAVTEALDEEGAQRPQLCSLGELPFLELFLYNARHVQHHTGQLNLLLRQSGHDAPRWVAQAKP